MAGTTTVLSTILTWTVQERMGETTMALTILMWTVQDRMGEMTTALTISLLYLIQEHPVHKREVPKAIERVLRSPQSLL
jgi:hypothetical protein